MLVTEPKRPVPAQPAPTRLQTALLCLVLVVLTLALYGRVAGFEFINYDDGEYVVENAPVQAGLTGPGLVWAFTTSHAGNWHPLTWISHMLDVELFGPRAGGAHVVNLLFHTANALLLFLLLKRMTGTLWRSALVAGLFAWHPLHVESVAWVSERKDVLSAFFFLLTLLAYGKYVERLEGRGGRGEESKVQSLKSKVPKGAGSTQSGLRIPHSAFWYGLSLCLFALGLMSKPMLVTLPFVLLLLDYWPLGRLGRPRTALINTPLQRGDPAGQSSPNRFNGLPPHPETVETVSSHPQPSSTPLKRGVNETGSTRSSGARGTRHRDPKRVVQSSKFDVQGSKFVLFRPSVLLEKLPFFALALASCVVTFAVQRQAGAVQSLTRLPVLVRLENAAVSYVRYLAKALWPVNLAVPYPHPIHWPLAEVLFATALVVGASALAVWLGRRRPYLFVGWFWFWGILIPVVGLVQVGFQSMADRYTYLPLVGVFVLLAWAAGEVVVRWPGLKPGVAGGAVLLLGLCAVRTFDQAGYWQNSGKLAAHALAVTKDNVTAYANLGNYQLQCGQVDEAIATFRRVFQMLPEGANSPRELVAALADPGRANDQAGQRCLEAFRARLGMAAAFPELLNSLGNALARKGQLAEAVQHYRAALRLRPNYAEAMYNLAFELSEAKDYAQAIELYQAAARVRPEQAKIRDGLGNALFRAGRIDEALTEFAEAVRLSPNHAERRNRLGLALANAGRPAEAIPHYEAALRADPGMAEVHNNLGSAFLGLGRVEEAARQFQLLLQVRPEHAGAHDNLGIALASMGQLDEAARQLREALRLAPDYANTHFNLGNVLASQRKLDEAAAEYREALRLAPDHPQAHCHLGAVLGDLGRRDEAAAQLREALRLRPDYAEAREQLQALGAP